MINLSGLNIYVAFVIGMALIGVYFWMLSDRISSKIRNSPYWFVGWFGGLMILASGAKLAMPVLDMMLSGTGLDDDEKLVPIMMGTMMVLVFALGLYHYLKSRFRQRRFEKTLYEFKKQGKA